ncbi:hypothetical protein Lser_V15G26766 [Lactuca serriola]
MLLSIGCIGSSLMCMDIDLNLENEDAYTLACKSEYIKVKVAEIMKREVEKATVLCFAAQILLDLIAFSLRNNKLKVPEAITKEIVKFKQLRALCLNDNPILQNL